MKSQTQSSRNEPDANETAGYRALIEGAALVEHDKTVLRLTGRDPAGMLDAILTNQVPEQENLGTYALLLNPKGRIQTDLRVLKDPSGGALLVVTEPEGADAALGILGRYAPFSRVKLEDVSGSWGILGVYGPLAGRLLGVEGSREHATTAVEAGGVTLLAAGVEAPVVGLDLLGPREALQTARDHLIGEGASPSSRAAHETARIEAGVPRFGADMTPENFPAETGTLDRAVSFEKGCYPGQETVARMRYRGHPNKTLYRLELEHPASGEEPEPGDEILRGEKKVLGQIGKVDVVGFVSSVAPLPVGDKRFVLGYLSRKADPEAPMRAEDARILSSRPV